MYKYIYECMKFGRKVVLQLVGVSYDMHNYFTHFSRNIILIFFNTFVVSNLTYARIVFVYIF